MSLQELIENEQWNLIDEEVGGHSNDRCIGGNFSLNLTSAPMRQDRGRVTRTIPRNRGKERITSPKFALFPR